MYGGSFNPVHEGHFHVSNIAIKMLQLDQIWWLVSTRNPFKSKSLEATVLDRLDQVKSQNKKYVVRPMALELKIKSVYSYETLNFLKMAKQLGHKIENGKTMFVYQALEAFKLWHKVEPKVNTDTFKLLEND